MIKKTISNDFIHYLALTCKDEAGSTHLPSLTELSRELEISVASLREQLEVAKALGFVEVRPRTGIRRLPYTFLPAVQQSLSYAMEIDQNYFDAFSELRNHIEAAYWYEAVELLEPEDYEYLKSLLERAWDKLHSPQIKIPHVEHRQLHMGIFRRLDNLFVIGILHAYWDAYEAVGLNMYAGYDYLQQVWGYHQRMVDAICSGDFESGYQALVEHKDLLYHRPVSNLMGEDVSQVGEGSKVRENF